MEVLELQSVWEVNVETLLQRLQTVGRMFLYQINKNFLLFYINYIEWTDSKKVFLVGK